MKKERWIWSLPIGWMVFIFLLSSQPYQDQNIQPLIRENINMESSEKVLNDVSVKYRGKEVSVHTKGTEGFIEFGIRKAAHLTVYFILMLLTYLALSKTNNCRFWENLLFAFLISSLYAGFDEFHQSITPNRTPYIGDVWLDMSGAFLACLVLVLRNQFRRIRFSK